VWNDDNTINIDDGDDLLLRIQWMEQLQQSSRVPPPPPPTTTTTTTTTTAMLPLLNEEKEKEDMINWLTELSINGAKV
jgi:hypothetical protein